MKNTKTIFFIEDERPLVESFSAFLRDKGYLIESASNGREAMERLPIVKPDLILLDIVMPEMNGIDFLKEVQKSGSDFADTPVLVLTNLQGDEGNFQKLGLKCAGYFVKANTPLHELANKIEAILKNS